MFFTFDQTARSPFHGRNAGGMGRDHRKSGPVYLNVSQMKPTEKTGKRPQDARFFWLPMGSALHQNVLHECSSPSAGAWHNCAWHDPWQLVGQNPLLRWSDWSFSLNGELSTCISIFLSIHLSFHLSIYLPIYLSICLFYLTLYFLIFPYLSSVILPFLIISYLVLSTYLSSVSYLEGHPTLQVTYALFLGGKNEQH